MGLKPRKHTLSPPENSRKILHSKAESIKLSKDSIGPVKLSFIGYTGVAVDLSDYGFDAPVAYNVDGITWNNDKKPIKYEHYKSVGHTTSLSIDGGQLKGEGVLSLKNDRAEEISSGIENGFPYQGSMGVYVPNTPGNITYIEKGIRVMNGRTFTAPHYFIEQSELDEMTVTENGRDGNTSYEFLNKEQRMTIKNSTPSETPPVKVEDKLPPIKVENKLPEPEPTPIPTPTPASDTFKMARQLMVDGMRLSRQYPDQAEYVEKSLSEGLDISVIENTVKYKALENKFNNGIPSPSQKGEDQTIEVRFMLGNGISPESLEKQGYDKKLIDNQYKRARMSLHETMYLCSRAYGGNYSGHSDKMDMVDFIRRNVVNSRTRINNTGFGTFDMPNLFLKAGKIMLEERWAIDPPLATKICKEVSNEDFRPTDKVRPNSGESWSEVKADSKVDLTTAGTEVFYRTQLKTSAQIMTLTRQEIINGDSDVIQGLLEGMAEGARMIPDLQLGRLMLKQASAAASFWVNADNSRTSFALNRGNLETAWNAVRQYSIAKGNISWNTMASSKWQLIVAPELEKTAFELMRQSTLVNDTTANTVTGQENFWYNMFKIVPFGNMANTGAFGASTFATTSSWVLWPLESRFAPYSICYLQGMKTPDIQTVDLPAELLGFGWRGVWDVAVNERERELILRAKA